MRCASTIVWTVGALSSGMDSIQSLLGGISSLGLPSSSSSGSGYCNGILIRTNAFKELGSGASCSSVASI